MFESDHTFNFQEEAHLVQDREDLISLLKMRFGSISNKIVESIYKLDSLDAIERLILVAANAPSYSVFLEEMEEGEDSFRIVGERFNPIESMMQGGDENR